MPPKNLICFETDLPNYLALKVTDLPEKVDIIKISISDDNDFNLNEINKIYNGQIIISCVSISRGGLFQGDKNKQIQIYNNLLSLGLDFLEIESSLISKVELLLKHKHTKIIISDINLLKTPGYRSLRKIAKQMSVFKPYFYQFNYKLLTEKDSTNLLRFLLAKKKKQRYIINTSGLNSEITNQELLKFGSGVCYL